MLQLVIQFDETTGQARFLTNPKELAGDRLTCYSLLELAREFFLMQAMKQADKPAPKVVGVTGISSEALKRLKEGGR